MIGEANSNASPAGPNAKPASKYSIDVDNGRRFSSVLDSAITVNSAPAISAQVAKVTERSLRQDHRLRVVDFRPRVPELAIGEAREPPRADLRALSRSNAPATAIATDGVSIICCTAVCH